MPTEATRLPDAPPGRIPDGLDMGQISYWKSDGEWWLYIPGGGAGRMPDHDITEHEDGTITVSPSIALKSGGQRRHGFLRRGTWHPCSDDQPPADGA